MEAGVGRSPWGINPELTVAPPELWPCYLTWCFLLLLKLIESRVSIIGNRSLLMSPPTLNEHTCVPGTVSQRCVYYSFQSSHSPMTNTPLSASAGVQGRAAWSTGKGAPITQLWRGACVAWMQTSWLGSPNLSLSTVVLFTLTFN